LNVADLDATEILSRDQLKTVFGGSDSETERSPTAKEKACSGKALCDPCSWVYQGTTNYGLCSMNAFAPYRYCSDLNCHY